MKISSRSKLWFYFAAIVFAIMLITAFIIAATAILLMHLDLLHFREGAAIVPTIFLLFISVLVGTAISIFVAQKILKPITAFSEVSREVAKGNFNVRMDQPSRINEIKELTHNFNRMISELSSIETLRNDFIVNVSHEFKTPIAAIEGYAMLLQDKDLSETEREEYTKMIISSSRQLSSLSGNILTLSKLENQEAVLEEKPFRLDEQIRQAILMLEPQWSVKELDLMIDLPNTIYYGNKKLLMQVWINLIGNAVKFTPKSGKITIELTSNQETTVVKISDSGCGIDKEALSRIFDKFYQGDTSRKLEGHGLGLPLVKRIIELTGGYISAESPKDKGSIFTVSLPN